ncbi:hypothetical protein DW657_13350 [Prevotella sp. AM23-5]|uniref:hypothetical protein n=1 Tax=Prevotellaceae TaxID=171552 RepID=UPI000E4F29B6|nr:MULTISPECIES: hypothetical protein [Prevotellaceae]RHN89483.1 hypothetical protein DW657_13350 [Prevotella sp. AM23-5]
MTLEEAKKILEKEFAVIDLHKSTEPFEFDDSNWFGYEKPSVLEAFRVLSKEGYYITISGHDYDMRKKRLEKEYEENTKAPGSAENSIKGDLSGNKSIEHCGEPIPGSPLSAVEGIKLKWKDNQNTSENPALAESASQFNDALLDEQAKNIAELTKENERLERVSKTMTDEFNELYYRMITKSDKIEALGKEIARLNKIIHKKNLKIEELGKESSRHLEGKMKMFGESFDLEQELKDKNAVLADVAEELRLSKIREKNLTELCQKYVKANEELKEKLANKVVDKIDAQALKSAESALAWKEKVIARKNMALAYYEKKIAEKDEVIADLGKELKVQKGLVNHISKKYDGAKINLNLRMKECEKLKEALEEKTKLVEIVRNGSKEYCDYGVAANEFIKELAHLYVLADKNGNINVEMLERCKNYQTYGFPANCNRETKKEINDIARGKTKVVGVDIAEEGEDHSGVIVLCGKDFIDAIKKMK